MLTQESIEKFESDVREGKNVGINDYVIEKNRDYSNGISKTGVFVSSLVEDFMAEGLMKIGDIFKKLFT